MTNLIESFESLHGAKFITINGYISSKTGEVANHNINVNVDIGKAKRDDLQTLKNYPHLLLVGHAEKYGVSMELAETALKELITSSENNLNRETANQNSKGQTDAYLSIGKGLRIHKQGLDFYVSGFANSKTVLIDGIYDADNRRPKTKVKDAIKKGLKMSQFRNFKITNGENIKVSGNTVQIL